MQKKNKGQHYIPNKSYLKNFSDISGMIWVLDNKDKIYPTNPSNIFKEGYFYKISLKDNKGGTLLVENTLANIESAYGNIYHNKIDKKLLLSIEEKSIVSVFLAAMYLRTKNLRNNLKKMFEGLQSKLEEWKTMFEKNKEARDFSSSLPSDPNAQTFSLEDIKNVIENSDEYHTITMMDALPYIAQIIFDMRWCYLTTTDKENGFITSDSPFQILRPESIKKYGPQAFGSSPGLLYEDSEVTIPLSSQMAILAGWKLEQESIFEADKTFVEQINLRTIMHANEKIIANNKSILERICNKTYPVEKM